MARKPKTTEGAKGADGAKGASKPAGRGRMLMIAGGVLGVLALGAGGFLMMGGHGGSGGGHGEAHGGHGGGHGEAHAEGAPGGGQAAFLEVRDMIVNLTPEPGQAKGGFLKLKVMLELRDARAEEAVKPLMPRVEDAFQTYMRELRASDLSGSAGLYRLREELLRRVNMAIHPARAEAVLFKDVVVQ